MKVMIDLEQSNKKAIALVALVLLAGSAGLFLMKRTAPAFAGRNNDSAELAEYDGKKLTPLKEFAKTSRGKPHKVDLEKYRLRITGLVERPQSYTYEQAAGIAPLHKEVATLHCVEGWTATILWEGVLFRDLVAAAKPQPAAKVAIFHSIDGYTSSLPLDYLMKDDVMVATKLNGVQAPPEIGFPFMLVAPLKWGYKWAKWIDEIELSDDESYQGYWERNGYDNAGDLGSPFMKGVKPSGCHGCHQK
jgi:DMSO/TMAO reductase YedYZ molybdopterin-dependent catalytic subunit